MRPTPDSVQTDPARHTAPTFLQAIGWAAMISTHNLWIVPEMVKRRGVSHTAEKIRIPSKLISRRCGMTAQRIRPGFLKWDDTEQSLLRSINITRLICIILLGSNRSASRQTLHPQRQRYSS